MKLVTLMENTGPRGLTAEHGLSLYLETGDRKILFDTGATGAFGDNARSLGVDLGQVDACILSHGHYDHGGGLGRFLECNDQAKIYVNQFAFELHYNAQGKDIGLNPEFRDNPRIIPVQDRLSLGEGLTLCTLPLPPEDNAGMTALEKGKTIPEDFRHEQYLLIEEGEKKILLSGCSHKGIRSIAGFFQPDVLIGGFHFMKIQDTAFLEAAARTLLQQKTVYYTGHCTGEAQYEVMKAVMGERLHCLWTGAIINL